MSGSQRCLIVELDICKKEELYKNNLGKKLGCSESAAHQGESSDASVGFL